MEIQIILTIAIALIVFAAVSRRLTESLISAPMVFLAVGLLIGPLGFDIVVPPDGHLIKLIAELTLVLVLFSDAVGIDLKVVCKERGLPIRLLTIGMPLCIGFGALAGLLTFPEIFFWEAAILAVILAPTDAALGQAVMTNPNLPQRIRQALNIESGLNDGVALPLIFMMLAIACGTAGIVPDDYEGQPWVYWSQFLALQLIAAPVIGLAIGWLGGLILSNAQRRAWSNDKLLGLAMVGIALLAFSAAELLHSSGLIASFVAGLVVGTRERAIAHQLHDFTEAEGQILTLLTFMLFGAVLFPSSLQHITWATLGYALLSLTLVRMIPVIIACMGNGLKIQTTLFMGWFGPRGLASILLILLVVQQSELRHIDQITAAAMLTVVLSIILHGLSAASLSRRYSNWVSAGCSQSTSELEDSRASH